MENKLGSRVALLLLFPTIVITGSRLTSAADTADQADTEPQAARGLEEIVVTAQKRKENRSRRSHYRYRLHFGRNGAPEHSECR